ncbi:hypothetical protein FRC07_009554 [Ceratobasidium sp. 392]|nr:hypothetical protein FRC07_009554 [Ceratobasidium sp. 392]
MSVSHPLSAEPTTTRRRNPPAPSSRPTSNYFSLKDESDARARHIPATLFVAPPADLGVRVEQEPGQNETPSTAHPTNIGAVTPMPRTPIFSVTDGDEDPASQMVLSTRWHTLSDEDIQANVASLSSIQSPSDESTHPYHDTIRILSAACERLVRQASALERARKTLQQQEARRKRAAERAVKDLKPGQRETGQQLLRAIYALEPTEPINNVSTTLEASKSPGALPKSISEAMQDVWTPPPREQPTLQLSQPLDIPSTSDAMSFVSGSRSRASSFTPGSSIASHSVKSEKTNASKTFLGGWFGRAASRAEENDDEDTDADVISVASGNISITAPGNSTAKMMSGVFRKGRNVFGAFGITPTPPSSIPTPPRPEPPQEPVDDTQDADARSTTGQSYLGSPMSKIGSLPFQAPLMSPVLPAVTTFSTKAPSITALSIDSVEPPVSVALEPPAPIHPAEHLKQHGHPAHLRAIVLATRVMTADPKSILADRGAGTSELIARGAAALVEEARQKAIMVYEPGGRPGELKRHKSKSKSRGASISRTGEAKGDADEDPDRAAGTISKAQGASASLGRALAEQNQLRDKAGATIKASAGSNASMGSKFRSLAPMAVAALGSPLLTAFPKSANTPTKPAQSSTSPAQSSSTNNPIAGPATTGPGGTVKKPPGRGTVELSSIVPVQMQPPTQFLSRAYTSSRLTSPSFRPQLATRFTIDLGSGGSREGKKLGMTDRYGFIYGVNAYDVRLLQRAREASSTAPACLTGMKVQERVEDDDEMPEMQSPEKMLESLEPDTSLADVSMATDLDRSMTASEIMEVAKSGSSSGKSRPSGSKRTPTLNTLPRAAPTTANTTPATATTSPPSSSTVRKLLDHLTALHDTQQATQKAEWDAFLKRRRQGGGGNLLGFMGGVDADEGSDEEREWGLGMLGFGRMDKASAKEFSRLVRGGVPLVYRDKVWSECSGATEMREPGVFQELLKSHEGVHSPTLKEIEKDVVRTMPLNVFFGGDGIGVSKLRRVLQAYSWRNPELGYCQGMNLIASTLLLVFSEEEDAFWVLTCIIEKFLPSEFFSGSLIESRACPLVLLDYVEIHHPKVYAHLLDMGVDLPAICFSWFLSLYTDCLPVETLFRAWDLVFAEGLDALFRIGLAIIRINEPDLLACDSAPTLYQYLEGMTARMWQADKLMKVESEIKSLMPHDELVRRREAHVAMLQSYA